MAGSGSARRRQLRALLRRSASRARSRSTTAAGRVRRERLVGEQRPEPLDVAVELGQLRRARRSAHCASAAASIPQPRRAERARGDELGALAPSAPISIGRTRASASRYGAVGRDGRLRPPRRPARRRAGPTPPPGSPPRFAGCGRRAPARRDRRRPSRPRRPLAGLAASARVMSSGSPSAASGAASRSACQISSVTNGMSGWSRRSSVASPSAAAAHVGAAVGVGRIVAAEVDLRHLEEPVAVVAPGRPRRRWPRTPPGRARRAAAWRARSRRRRRDRIQRTGQRRRRPAPPSASGRLRRARSAPRSTACS